MTDHDMTELARMVHDTRETVVAMSGSLETIKAELISEDRQLKQAVETMSRQVIANAQQIGSLTTTAAGLQEGLSLARQALSVTDAKVSEHDDWLRWAQRLVLGMVLTAIVAVAFILGSGGVMQ